MNTRDRYRGCLLGLAAGDALGTTLEFRKPGTFPPITDMIGGGPFRLQPGQWTDDTSMALCLAESLLECNKFDPIDQMDRYVNWRRHGHLSSTGRCFDIGNTVACALDTFEKERRPYCGLTAQYSAGNGSLMRLAPVPMYFRSNPLLAIRCCADSSRTTHAIAIAVDACRYFGGLLVGALNGRSKEELLAPTWHPEIGNWKAGELVTEIEKVARGSFRTKEPSAIRGTGFVSDTLEAALWAFNKSASFAEGALLAVNLGDDADTTGAVYGQLAGAVYGVDSIPSTWRCKIAHLDMILDFADRLENDPSASAANSEFQ